ncbi:hypothetical protein GCM10022291_10190 [Postechiella marina]|uniref:UspA domain-containing protein n=1 Tax=Postechiella marina TaxID=943941 RepID=A0ABP8C4C6_9FLAO
MTNNKYKILMLTDLKSSPEHLLENALNLAKHVNGDLDIFHVKKASEVVEKDNQLNAIRSIKDEHKIIDKRIKNLISSSSNLCKINYSYSLGYIKDEIEKHIKEIKPDIIVLGKRKTKSLNIIGDNITRFILKKYKGDIFIASSNSVIKQKSDMSLGIFNNTEKTSNIANDLVACSKKPIKSFKIIDSLPSNKKEENINSNPNIIEYAFEKQPNTFKNISKYLLKSKVDLFCVNRKNDTNTSFIKKTELEQLVSSINIPLFITG